MGNLLNSDDDVVNQQLAVDEVNRRNIASLFLPIDPVNPCLVLHVSRDNLVQDTINQLSKQAVMDLKKPLKVAAMLHSFGLLHRLVWAAEC